MSSDPRVEKLIAAARGVREHAHAPYSGFEVGAAVLAGGRIFTGVLQLSPQRTDPATIAPGC